MRLVGWGSGGEVSTGKVEHSSAWISKLVSRSFHQMDERGTRCVWFVHFIESLQVASDHTPPLPIRSPFMHERAGVGWLVVLA